MKKQLKVPKFKSEAAERKFWSKINLVDHFKPDDFSAVSFPNLKPTSRSISLRVPYQSLMKKYLADGVLQKK